MAKNQSKTVDPLVLERLTPFLKDLNKSDVERKCGVGKSTVDNLIAGKNVGYASFVAVADHLGIDPFWIVLGRKNRSSYKDELKRRISALGQSMVEQVDGCDDDSSFLLMEELTKRLEELIEVNASSEKQA